MHFDVFTIVRVVIAGALLGTAVYCCGQYNGNKKSVSYCVFVGCISIVYLMTIVFCGRYLVYALIKWPMKKRNMIAEFFWLLSVIVFFVITQILYPNKKRNQIILLIEIWTQFLFLYVGALCATRLYLDISPIIIGILEVLTVAFFSVLCFVRRDSSRTIRFTDFSSLLLLAVVCFFLGQIVYNGMNPVSLKYLTSNVLLILAAELLVMLLTGTMNTVFWAFPPLFLFWTLVHKLVLQSRGSAFQLNDVKNSKVVVSMLRKYLSETPFVMNRELFWYLLFMTFTGFLSVSLGRIAFTSKRKGILIGRLGGSIGICFGVFCAINLVSINSDIEGYTYWTSGDLYHRIGYTLGFFEINNIYKTNIPEGYKPESIVSLADQYKTEKFEASQEEKMEQPGEQTPDIVVIINESLADLNHFGNLKANRDFIPYIRNSNKNHDTRTGRVAVSHCGSEVTNVEYEFLTSRSFEFAPTMNPFMQMNSDECPSLISVLKQQGYTTIATIPENSNRWNRDSFYQMLGFDDFQSRETAVFRGDDGAGQVSDSAVYEKVLEILGDSKFGKDPRFVYCVTTQNKRAFSTEEDMGRSFFNGEEGYDTTQVNHYLALMSDSDRAYESLIAEVDKLERPTIVMMIGSGFKKLDDGFYSQFFEFNPMYHSNLNAYMPLYAIHANYDVHLKTIPRDTSVIYMAPYLLQVTGLKRTPFMNYLLDMGNSIPVINQYGCKTRKGNYLLFDSQKNNGGINWRVKQYNEILYSLKDYEKSKGMYALE